MGAIGWKCSYGKWTFRRNLYLYHYRCEQLHHNGKLYHYTTYCNHVDNLTNSCFVQWRKRWKCNGKCIGRITGIHLCMDAERRKCRNCKRTFSRKLFMSRYRLTRMHKHIIDYNIGATACNHNHIHTDKCFLQWRKQRISQSNCYGWNSIRWNKSGTLDFRNLCASTITTITF